jgi:hypothetical protein
VLEKKQLQEQIQKLTRKFVNFDTNVLSQENKELNDDKVMINRNVMLLLLL